MTTGLAAWSKYSERRSGKRPFSSIDVVLGQRKAFADRNEDDPTMTDPIRFFLDGAEVEALPGETIWQVANRQRHRDPASVLAAQARLPRRRQLPRLHGRDRGRAGAGRLLHPQAGAGHEGADRERARPLLAQAGVRAAGRRPAVARGGARPEFALLAMGRPARGRRQPLSAPRRAGARPQPSGDGGAARRLHPVQSVRARLPRGPGQRRDRHGGARPSRKDRVRFRRPDGQRAPASPAANACRPARPAR